MVFATTLFQDQWGIGSRLADHCEVVNGVCSDLSCTVRASFRLLFSCSHCATAAMAEWLRRWTRNPMGYSRAGSNPVRSVSLLSIFNVFFLSFYFQAEKEAAELSFQLESLTERLDEAEGFQSAQVLITSISYYT